METTNGRAWPRRGNYAIMATALGALLVAGCAPSYQGARESSMLASDASCTSSPSANIDTPIDPAAPDQRLMDEAIRHFVNRERCSRSLPPLGAASTAAEAARGQASAMATHNFMSHTSPVPGHETFVRRLGAANARFRRAGETLAQTSLFALGRTPYEVVDASRCVFRKPGGGPLIPRQSYRMLAERVVELWMNSPKHRDNILTPDFRRIGSGVAVRPEPNSCGQASAASVFLG